MATYEYIIRNETNDSGGNASPVAPVSPGTAGTQNKPASEQQSGNITVKGVAKTLAKSFVVRESVSIAKSELLYKANTVELRTGCKDLQQKVDLQMQIGSIALSVLGSAVAGFIVGGPVGAAASVGLSVLTRAIGFAQSTSQAQRTIDLKQSIENQTINMNMIRAGSRGSRGNYEQ